MENRRKGIVMYWFAQSIGVLVAVCCIVGTQMKHKWQMLLFSTAANLLNGISFFFLGGALPAALLCWVAVFQTLLFSYQAYRNIPINIVEKLIFLAIYLAVGIWKIETYIDILPCMGSVLFVLGTFCKKEQHMRCVYVVSNSVWIAYDIVIMSTAIISQVLSLSSNLIAIYRYRNRSESLNKE